METADDEYEEEEVVVLAELNGLVDDELLKKGCTFQFVGIENEKPVLQLGKYNFLGDYEDQIGSALFLKETTDSEGHKAWSKLCFSDKKLAMQRVFLRRKGEEWSAPAPPAATATDMEQDSGAEPDPLAVTAADMVQDPLAVTAADMEQGSAADPASASDPSGEADMQSAEPAGVAPEVQGSGTAPEEPASEP